MAQLASGRLLFGVLADRLFVRVEGRATHLNSQPLRELLEVMIQRGQRRVEVDLGGCTFLDSTFVGVLSVAALRLEGKGGGVRLFRATDRCLELFRGLGVERYFELVRPGDEPALPPSSALGALPTASRTRIAWATTILEAHRVLSEADPANLPRLRDVLALMEKGPLEPGLLASRGQPDVKN